MPKPCSRNAACRDAALGAAMGEHFLRLAGVASLDEALGVVADSSAPLTRRLLAIGAVGWLGDALRNPFPEGVGRQHPALRRGILRAQKLQVRRLKAGEREGRRRLAAELAVRWGWRNAPEALAALTDSTGPSHRRAAVARWLGGMGCREAVPELITALESRDPLLIADAKDGLCLLETRCGARRLIRLIGDRGQRREARIAAIQILSDVFDTRTESVLVAVGRRGAADDVAVRKQATHELVYTLSRRTSQQALLERLRDPSPGVRIEALSICRVDELRHLPAIWEAVAALADDPAHDDAPKTLGELLGPEAAAGLPPEILNDAFSSETVGEVARRILRQLDQ